VFSYLNARAYDDEADACALAAVEKRFLDASGDIAELIVAIAASDPFMYRRVPERAP
jgi:hypothetical protein